MNLEEQEGDLDKMGFGKLADHSGIDETIKLAPKLS